MRATLDKDPAEVAAMFDEVAPRYDLTNTVLSLGMDRGWRTAVRRALDLRPGQRVLDLAAGTATSSAALARTGADVAVAISGVAGPHGGSDKKPVGTVIFARARRGADPREIVADRKEFGDLGRGGIRLQAALCALELLMPVEPSP